MYERWHFTEVFNRTRKNYQIAVMLIYGKGIVEDVLLSGGSPEIIIDRLERDFKPDYLGQFQMEDVENELKVAARKDLIAPEHIEHLASYIVLSTQIGLMLERSNPDALEYYTNYLKELVKASRIPEDIKKIIAKIKSL